MESKIAIALSAVAIGLGVYNVVDPTIVNVTEITQVYDDREILALIDKTNVRVDELGLTIGQVSETVTAQANELKTLASEYSNVAINEVLEWWEWAKSNLPSWVTGK